MIYLDNAATTLIKPPEVLEAAAEALRSMGSPGRGEHLAARKAEETVFSCREELAEMFGTGNPERVVLTFNATHGLNIAIKSLVPHGGRVVISGYEHNAVTRPLRAIGADVTVAKGPLFEPAAVLNAFDRAIVPGVDAVICNHVSNVFGFVQPIGQIAELCKSRGVPLIVDASQSAGVLPLELHRLGAAFVAMPGHKGLYGPQGTGVLLCGEGVWPRTLLEGGTGSASRLAEMPEHLPDRLEAGTLNMPGIAGLLAGVRFLKRSGIWEICRKERLLALRTAEELNRLPGVRVFAGPGLPNQTGVVSFTVENREMELLAERLSRREIAVRAGLHCAPLAHQSAGTIDGGTIRVSFSCFNTLEEVDSLVSALKAEIS